MVLETMTLSGNSNYGLKFRVAGRYPGPVGLPFAGDERIQSIHVLYEDEGMKNLNLDYQLFKIVYPKSTLDEVLERMR